MNMFIVCCIPFFIAAGFHLSACLFGKERQADASKKILMPLLILAAVSNYFFELKYGSSAFKVGFLKILLISAALAAGNAGDIFLLGDVKPATMIKGLCAFLIGHCIYICSLFIVFPPIFPPVWIIIAAAIVYALGVFLSWLSVGKPRGRPGKGAVIYAAVLSLFSLLTLIRVFGTGYANGTHLKALIKIYTGTVLFLASDSILSQTIFFKPFYQSRFTVMLTYISAQFFIVWGFFSV
ncbi:hypothetical protein H0R92_07330 [Treponema sp. OMZ 840]|uniref:lysoplasmalogenase family protein n=1 Tax=Treponema sp. OMZ 840 TaxID=244313 RepID=UPI003D8CFE67